MEMTTASQRTSGCRLNARAQASFGGKMPTRTLTSIGEGLRTDCGALNSSPFVYLVVNEELQRMDERLVHHREAKSA